MMDAKEISQWFHNEKQKQQQEAEVETARMEKRAQEAQQQHNRALQNEQKMLDREAEVLRKRIAFSPPVYLHNRFDMTTKRRMKKQLANFDGLECFFQTGFNKGLLIFGSPWFTLMALLASMALAFQWMQNRFGLDAVKGSESWTLLTIAVLALVLDLVSFMLLTGVLVGLKNFLGRERHVSVLSKTIFGASIIGVIGFGIVLIQRLVEVDL